MTVPTVVGEDHQLPCSKARRSGPEGRSGCVSFRTRLTPSAVSSKAQAVARQLGEVGCREGSEPHMAGDALARPE